MRKMQQRSTKGASKQRRELINTEITKIRDLLPAVDSVRNRLSQLQIMSFCNAFIAKCNFFEDRNTSFQDHTSLQFTELSELLPGFLLMVTVEGKVLYLSESILEHLGHSMVDILTHIDSIYDLIDSCDHKMVKDVLDGVKSGVSWRDEWSFVCRMGLNRKLHQNLGLSDQKLMQVRGFFKAPVFNIGTQSPVFLAHCTPRLKVNLASDPGVLFNTTIYESLHGLDMKYLDISRNGEVHLGYSQKEIRFRSWYEFIHPEDVQRAVTVHKSLMYCESDSWSPLFVRMQTKDGALVWVCVLLSRVKIPNGTGTEGIGTGIEGIVCVNQVVGEQDILHECEVGVLRLRYGDGFASNASPRADDFLTTSSSGSDFAANRCCSGREEVLRRLKRKMAMNEIQRKKSLLATNVKTSPLDESREKPTAFSYDFYPLQENGQESGDGTKEERRKTSDMVQADCDSSSYSFRKDSSSSSSSSSHGSVFQGISSAPPLLSIYSLCSPTRSNLTVSCDEAINYVTSMPTPKFGSASMSPETYSYEVRSPEGDEVVNLVEEMMERKPFRDDSWKFRGAAKGRQASYELPHLCPGVVDDFFREFDGCFTNNLSSSVEFAELGAQSFTGFEVSGSPSAGQTSADLGVYKWPSKASGDATESMWPEYKRQDLSAFYKHGAPVWVNQPMTDYNCSDDVFYSSQYNNNSWNGFANCLMAD